MGTRWTQRWCEAGHPPALFLGLPACLALYFVTPLLPATSFGVPLGATFVVFFALLFVQATVRVLQRTPPSGIVLGVVALCAVAGVWGVNRSLYNFTSLPSADSGARYVEGADRVEFVQPPGDTSGAGTVVFSSLKRFWLAKTFAIDILLFTAAVAIALLIGRQVEKPSHIFAIVVLGAVMDVWSVTRGATERIAASPHTAYYFLFNWPLAGLGGVTCPLIGAADFLFAALFLTVANRFGLPWTRNVVGIGSAVSAAVVVALITGVGVPALPFIGVAVVALNFRAILPDRRELLQILVGAAVILAIFQLLWR